MYCTVIAVTDEVGIAGIFKHEGLYIHGIFSVRAMQSLNWYYNGVLLGSPNSRYIMETDGLNAVLHINEVSIATFGKYTLIVEGTKLSESVILSEGDLM